MTYTTEYLTYEGYVDDMKRLRSRAFKAREVCADFEELRCLPMNCQRKDIPDEGPRGEVERGSGIGGRWWWNEMEDYEYALVIWHFKEFAIHMSQKYYTHQHRLLLKAIIQLLRSSQNAL
jgi:hypothetical protein